MIFYIIEYIDVFWVYLGIIIIFYYILKFTFFDFFVDIDKRLALKYLDILLPLESHLLY